MQTKSFTKTVVCQLASSNRKNQRIKNAIQEWQAIAKSVADHHPSFPEYEWGRTKQNPSYYRIVQREHPDSSLHSQGTLAAVHKVGDSFESWKQNGKRGERPQFGDGDYCRFTDSGIEIERNDTGYGVKVKLEPYNPEWFSINTSPYQLEYLEAIENGEMEPGSAELHYDGTSPPSLHLAVTEEIEVHEPDDCNTVLGVDLGENTLYAAAVLSDGEVEQVKMESGSEFRHYRDRLQQKRERMMEKDDLRAVKQCEDEHRRYTDYMTHTASRSLVDLASDHAPCVIAVEDLTGYREDAEDPIHDWPQHEIRTKIAYKAKEAGLPMVQVNPEYTSETCRKCGHCGDSRHKDEFKCVSCGYEVHADVNAAFNIAGRAIANTQNATEAK